MQLNIRTAFYVLIKIIICGLKQENFLYYQKVNEIHFNSNQANFEKYVFKITPTDSRTTELLAWTPSTIKQVSHKININYWTVPITSTWFNENYYPARHQGASLWKSHTSMHYKIDTTSETSDALRHSYTF